MPGSNDDECGDYNSNEWEETPTPDSVICVVRKGLCILLIKNRPEKPRKLGKNGQKMNAQACLGLDNANPQSGVVLLLDYLGLPIKPLS